MPTLQMLVPDPEVLIQLEPEELGALLLQALASRPPNERMFHTSNYESELFGSSNLAYPRTHQDKVLFAIREAFAWLEGQALIIPADSMNGRNGWRVIGRRGRRLTTPTEWEAYRKASLLPKQLLHSSILETVYLTFIRGDYETAVFQAFKLVEVNVRIAANLSNEDVGVKLMRKAFDKNSGPLTDPSAEEGEREALAHLFAGAIGSYKNPHSHRTVTISDASDAVEMIMLASHLLKIVDTRRNNINLELG
jgi:uncharacterized protein (TIGR02391 family)